MLAMQIFFTIYFFMMGALFASFYNVVGIRVFDHCSLLRSSQCPKCNHKLRWCDIIPVFGYLINDGKCHFCKEPIHIKYFLIEIFGGTLLALGFWFLGFSLEFVYLFIIYSMLLVVAVSYYEYHKMMNVAIYIFYPVALAFIIYFEIVNNSGIIYKSLLGAGILALLCYLLKFINPNNRKYLLFSIAVGFAITYDGLLLFLPIFGLGMVIKLLVKKIPTLYIVAFATIISFIFSSPLIELIKNL